VKKLKVLIVDDSSVMRKIVERALRQAGLELSEVAEASNGAEALAEVQKGVPDMILSDINMPVMDGLEFLKALRLEQNLGDIRLMVVTTETEVGRMAEALAEGAHEYVMKPFTQDVIFQKLELLGLGARAQ
jgi:two-component system chemotaxis response regulator CheY